MNWATYVSLVANAEAGAQTDHLKSSFPLQFFSIAIILDFMYCNYVIICMMLKNVRFVQAAVSLAVVIPSLLELQAEYYGVEKGIPTLVMAAASFDNVLSISGFGVCLGLSYHSG